MTRKRWAWLGLVVALAAGAARAQTSASYHLNEHTLDTGGDPRSGPLASTSFHLKLDAIGDAALGSTMASPSFHADGGFVVVYRPPGEVAALTFPTKTTLSWSPEPTIGFYELYRDSLSSLSSGSTGTCLVAGITGTSATDSATPSTGAGWFYLVTARNRLNEEGTKGRGQGGAPRPNPTPCP